jgi:hypothetical protein
MWNLTVGCSFRFWDSSNFLKKWTSKVHIFKWYNFLVFNPRHLKKDRPWKKSHFFGDHFFLWTGWTTQLQIWHRLRSAFHLTTDTKNAKFPQITCHFWYHSNWSLYGRLLGAFTAAYSITVLVSWYPSMDMNCIVSPVNFDSRLSISVLRNKQLFKKRRTSKAHIFKNSKF